MDGEDELGLAQLVADASAEEVRAFLDSVSVSDRARMATEAMDAAAQRANPGIVEALIQAGAELRPSHLHGAAAAPGTRAVEILLAGGLDPNASDPEGRTALHHAVSKDVSGQDPFRTTVVEVLLAAGANSEAVDQRGRTPADLARAHGLKLAVQALGARPGWGLSYADVDHIVLTSGGSEAIEFHPNRLETTFVLEAGPWRERTVGTASAARAWEVYRGTFERAAPWFVPFLRQMVETGRAAPLDALRRARAESGPELCVLKATKETLG